MMIGEQECAKNIVVVQQLTYPNCWKTPWVERPRKTNQVATHGGVKQQKMRIS